MSEMTDTPVRRRNRAGEAGERRRGADHVAGRCITCGRPSRTWRCTSCTRELELRTERYRGKGTRGPATKSAADALDLRLAFEELGRAIVEFAEADGTQVSPRLREEALAAPLARLGLSQRLLRSVRNRHRRAEIETARTPRTAPRPPQLVFAFFRSGAMKAR